MSEKKILVERKEIEYKGLFDLKKLFLEIHRTDFVFPALRDTLIFLTETVEIFQTFARLGESFQIAKKIQKCG